MNLFERLVDMVKPMPKEFLTPTQLGVTRDQFCALMKVADGLQSGRLKHYRPNGRPINGEMFNMGTWSHKQDCGSVCCIGGWAETYLPRGGSKYIKHAARDGLHDLFFPPQTRDWTKITPTQAARAITNWARTGNPHWKKAMRHD